MLELTEKAMTTGRNTRTVVKYPKEMVKKVLGKRLRGVVQEADRH